MSGALSGVVWDPLPLSLPRVNPAVGSGWRVPSVLAIRDALAIRLLGGVRCASLTLGQLAGARAVLPHLLAGARVDLAAAEACGALA